MTFDTTQDIEHAFTYHAPTVDQIRRYAQLRQTGMALALLIHELCPESPERGHALHWLDCAVMQANASIARHE